MSEAAQVKEAAAAQMSQATERARRFAEDSKNVAAERLSGVSSAIHRVADQLSADQATAPVAGYAHDLAGGISRMSENVRSNSIDDLVAVVQDFGRRQPVAFLGASALAGFVASRFVMASAHRRHGPEGTASADDQQDAMEFASTSAPYPGDTPSSEETGAPSGTNGGTIR
jgi:hypothetical protein